ncbi:unnamed protein product, partial [Prunus brigantina]
MLFYRSVLELMEGLNFVEVGGSRWRRQRVASSRWVERCFDFRVSPRENSLSLCVRQESSVEAISGESFRHQRRFPTCANGKPGDFRCCERARDIPERDFKVSFGTLIAFSALLCYMSDRESYPEREPNAFDGESSDGLFNSDNEAVGPDAEDGSDTDVEIIGEGSQSVPSHGIGKGLMTAPIPLSIVYSDGRRVGLAAPGESSAGHQSEPSTSGRGASSAEPSSQPRVSVLFPDHDRVPMGVPKEHVFGVDYLEPNRITEREIAKYRAEYFIPDSVGIRIPGPKETLSRPKEGEVVFFTDVLLQGVRLPLQPAVQKILAQIGYAPGQFNPNFWVALMGVVTAFGMAGEGEPSYEQFSHLYSITKSKCSDHGGWVQANCLKATERGHFISGIPTSQKTWGKRRVILSGDWESPSGHPVRFHIPTTFQIAGKLKQPIATQSEIRQIERVRLRVPAVERVYPKLLFTANLIKAQLANPADMTEEKRAAEAKRMSESSKRHLMLGSEGKKKRGRQAETPTVPASSAGVDVEDQTLSERLCRLNSDSAPPRSVAAGPSPGRGVPAEGTPSRAASKRPFTDDDAPADPVTLAYPSKTVQFVNHMILGSQMELSEIKDLPKKLLREEAGRAFRLQASASMDMWLCINAAEKAKKAYDDGRAKVAEAGKAIQDHAHLVKDMQAAERQIKGYEAKFSEMVAAMESAQLAATEAREAKEAIQVAMEESERKRDSDIEAAVQEAIRKYRHSTDFSALLDKEVGSEMVDLVYRFKRYNPGVKLNLNFIADPPPLPEGMTEEMIEDYEGEDAPEGPAESGEEQAGA